MSEYKKYDVMENILQDINSKHISLEDWEKKRNNEILGKVLTTVIQEFKKQSSLFKNLYTEPFYGGSYYDRLKVGQPNEFDVDLLLKLHDTFKVDFISDSSDPGFVRVKLNDLTSMDRHPNLKEKYRGLEELYDENRQLDTVNVLTWLQRIVYKASVRYVTTTNYGDVHVKVSIGPFSPACTLNIRSSDGTILMDIDLVPCFVFEEEELPNPYKIKYKLGKKETFFIVPKHPRESSEKTNYWRLSFQQQERALLEGKERLKSAVKLIKKLRDTQEQSKISSYFLKTIALLEIELHPENFWNDKSLSYCFMKLLEAYRDRLQQKTIPYFWYREYNLIGTIKDSTLINFYYRIKYIIADIDRNPGDKHVLEKYIIGKKVLNPKNDEENPIQPNIPNDTASTIAAGVVISATILGLGIAIYNKFRNNRRRDNQ